MKGRLVLFLLVSIFYFNPTSAQIQNGGFEFGSCTGGIPFFGCNELQPWQSSHGFPFIESHLPHEGSKYAAIPTSNPFTGCSSGGNSGIFYQFDAPLVNGGEYDLSFCYRNEFFDDDGVEIQLLVQLTNGLTPNGQYNQCDDTPFFTVCPDCTLFEANVTNGNWLATSSVFTVPTSGTFDQIIFHVICRLGCDSPGSVDIDNVVLDEPCTGINIQCTEESDLTACADEDDYGFIAVKCQGQFSWSFPAGSTALEYTSSNQSIIVNASEGTYTLTITDSEGCEEVRTYEIVEDCCPALPCDLTAPTNLGCQKDGAILTWDEVPGATSYTVYIIPNSAVGECCPEGTNTTANEYTTIDPKLELNISFFCAAWYVKANCDNGGESPASEYACLGQGFDCRRGERSQAPDRVGFSSDFNVFPNPANSQVTIELKKELTEETPARLTIVDLYGKTVLEEILPAGTRQKTVATDHLTNGLYFVKISIGNEDVFIKEIAIID